MFQENREDFSNHPCVLWSLLQIENEKLQTGYGNQYRTLVCFASTTALVQVLFCIILNLKLMKNHCIRKTIPKFIVN